MLCTNEQLILKTLTVGEDKKVADDILNDLSDVFNLLVISIFFSNKNCQKKWDNVQSILIFFWTKSVVKLKLLLKNQS